jgi:hypothetical protein
MIIEVLAAHAVAISVRIVPTVKYARIRDVGREEVAELVYIVRRRPGLVIVAVQAMYCNDAANCQDDL